MNNLYTDDSFDIRDEELEPCDHCSCFGTVWNEDKLPCCYCGNIDEDNYE